MKCNLIKTQLALQKLFEFSIHISKNYYDNPYHSFKHAIDVAYMVFYLVEDMAMGEQLELSLEDKAMLYISALTHDVLHPGTNNLFQVRSCSDPWLIQILMWQKSMGTNLCLRISRLLL